MWFCGIGFMNWEVVAIVFLYFFVDDENEALSLKAKQIYTGMMDMFDLSIIFKNNTRLRWNY